MYYITESFRIIKSLILLIGTAMVIIYCYKICVFLFFPLFFHFFLLECLYSGFGMPRLQVLYTLIFSIFLFPSFCSTLWEISSTASSSPTAEWFISTTVFLISKNPFYSWTSKNSTLFLFHGSNIFSYLSSMLGFLFV